MKSRRTGVQVSTYGFPFEKKPRQFRHSPIEDGRWRRVNDFASTVRPRSGLPHRRCRLRKRRASPPISRRRFVNEDWSLREAIEQCLVEEFHERRHGPEDPQQLPIEGRARREGCLVLAGSKELLELQVARGGVILHVAPRDARQSLTGHLADGTCER